MPSAKELVPVNSFGKPEEVGIVTGEDPPVVRLFGEEREERGQGEEREDMQCMTCQCVSLLAP
jgi:hypothetical protein